jgi:hypothetical protein
MLPHHTLLLLLLLPDADKRALLMVQPATVVGCTPHKTH